MIKRKGRPVAPISKLGFIFDSPVNTASSSVFVSHIYMFKARWSLRLKESVQNDFAQVFLDSCEHDLREKSVNYKEFHEAFLFGKVNKQHQVS